MRHTVFAFAGCLLLGGPALGATGDLLLVVGDGVNVRAGPSLDQRIKLQVSRGRQMIEIEREGDWVHVEIVGESGEEGWIHDSLVAAQAQAEPEAAEAAPPAPEASQLAEEPADSQSEATGAPATMGEATESASAISPAPGLIEPAASSEVDPVDLQRFRDSVDYLNSRSLAVAGVDLFTEVEPLGGGAVQVGTTEAWATMPPPEQQSYASTLLDRWAAATGRAGRVKVQIVDESGQLLMEESKP